jgi:mycothiol synthase
MQEEPRGADTVTRCAEVYDISTPEAHIKERNTLMLGIHTPQAPISMARPEAADLMALQEVWSASQDRDEPAGRPRGGWWSIPDWATAMRILKHEDRVIGFAAIEYQPGADAAEARLGLLPADRRPGLAERLIRVAVDLARAADAPRVRLYTPEAAAWTIRPARAWGFRALRAQQLMLRSPSAPPMSASSIPGTQIRVLRTGEDSALLEALNRAWAGTWNFRPITATALEQDLGSQRSGMLVLVADGEESSIVGTVHAQFDPAHRNPDGSPYAWISNLTIDPIWRGKGLGLALLAAGLTHLQQRGARSVALSVDGGNDAALNLYRSAGFIPISTVVNWERVVEGIPMMSS